jgi:hypothetical protein
MNLFPYLLSLLTAAASAAAAASPPAVAPPDEPLACRLDAFSPAQRARHQKLTALLERALVGVRELPDGYELALDLSRLPADTKGDPVCVVEIAEWVDLEARCCPFLDFGIAVRGKGVGSVALALTGGPGVKDFLKMEFSLVDKKLESRP